MPPARPGSISSVRSSSSLPKAMGGGRDGHILRERGSRGERVSASSTSGDSGDNGERGGTAVAMMTPRNMEAFVRQGLPLPAWARDLDIVTRLYTGDDEPINADHGAPLNGDSISSWEEKENDGKCDDSQQPQAGEGGEGVSRDGDKGDSGDRTGSKGRSMSGDGSNVTVGAGEDATSVAWGVLGASVGGVEAPGRDRAKEAWSLFWDKMRQPPSQRNARRRQAGNTGEESTESTESMESAESDGDREGDGGETKGEGGNSMANAGREQMGLRLPVSGSSSWMNDSGGSGGSGGSITDGITVRERAKTEEDVTECERGGGEKTHVDAALCYVSLHYPLVIPSSPPPCT